MLNGLGSRETSPLVVAEVREGPPRARCVYLMCGTCGLTGDKGVVEVGPGADNRLVSRETVALVVIGVRPVCTRLV